MSFQLQNFLSSGAFFRRSDGVWTLGSGVQEPISAATPGKLMFFSPPFFVEGKPSWFSFDRVDHWNVGDLQKILEFDPAPKMRSMGELMKLAGLGASGHMRLVDWQWESANHELFADEFKDILGKMETQELEKVVPLTHEECSQKPSHEVIKKIMHRLLITPEGQFPYGFWHEGQGILGCTPEQLFRWDKQSLFTQAIAGTRPSDAPYSLLDDEKEMEEHKFVVDDLEKVFSQWGDVQIGSTHEWDIGLLTHLRTDIKVNLSGNLSVPQLIESLHPTPALGGVPRRSAMDWLKNSKSSANRYRYGAPFGFQDENGNGEFVVGIRNIQWREDKTYLYSGCGIVKQSQLEKEWNELYAKRMKVKSQLGL
tara:strand:- start:17328 stop:18428 length:1101 start_codon:yes stop_codon:yes gene_type:complete